MTPEQVAEYEARQAKEAAWQPSMEYERLHANRLRQREARTRAHPGNDFQLEEADS